MSEMLYGDIPDFELIFDTIKRLEKEINSLQKKPLKKKRNFIEFLNNIFAEGELNEDEVCSILELTAGGGKKYKTKKCNKQVRKNQKTNAIYL